MIFLINYDRSSGRLLELRRFEDGERQRASEERLALEVELHRAGYEREVVLLEATDEEALRRTHRRYFEDLAELSVPAAYLPPPE